MGSTSKKNFIIFCNILDISFSGLTTPYKTYFLGLYFPEDQTDFLFNNGVMFHINLNNNKNYINKIASHHIRPAQVRFSIPFWAPESILTLNTKYMVWYWVIFVAIVIPPPPPPPLPSRSPKSIGDSQNLEAPTTPSVPSSAPGTIENEAANHNPSASGPGRPPSPNPGLILTPTIDHQGINYTLSLVASLLFVFGRFISNFHQHSSIFLYP